MDNLKPTGDIDNINTFMEESSQQMLTLVDIINAFTTENNALKQKIIELNQPKKEECNMESYLYYQNIVLLILLLFVIILFFVKQ